MSKDLRKARAIKLVMERHNPTQTYDEFPYIVHCLQVLDVLVEFGYSNDEALCLAGILHDILEDTATSFKDIQKLFVGAYDEAYNDMLSITKFGADVAELVYCVTDELGRNRKERHINTYPKTSSNPRAVYLKLADRIANTRWAKNSSFRSMFGMYRDEYEDFKAALWKPENDCEMWQELDRLYGIASS